MVMSELWWWMGGIWFQSRQQTLALGIYVFACHYCPLPIWAVRNYQTSSTASEIAMGIGSELRATFARFEAADGSLSHLPAVRHQTRLRRSLWGLPMNSGQPSRGSRLRMGVSPISHLSSPVRSCYNAHEQSSEKLIWIDKPSSTPDTNPSGI